MKTKLLKKVRRRFSINFYPQGNRVNSKRRLPLRYELVDHEATNLEMGFRDGYNMVWHETMEEAIASMMHIIRSKYKKYSIGYKRAQLKRKVWHNG